MQRLKNPLLLVGCLLLTLLTGGISGFVTIQNINTWYPTLHKPFFNPPNAIFGPVWTLLYTLMGISFYLILKQPKSVARTNAIGVFTIQLVLNFFWSIIFFNFHFIALALIDIVFMWAAILLMIILFHRISRFASLLQLPYLAWVSFATLLNAAILHLN